MNGTISPRVSPTSSYSVRYPESNVLESILIFNFSRIFGVSVAISSTTHSIQVRLPIETCFVASSKLVFSSLNGTPCSSIPAILTVLSMAETLFSSIYTFFLIV